MRTFINILCKTINIFLVVLLFINLAHYFNLISQANIEPTHLEATVGETFFLPFGYALIFLNIILIISLVVSTIITKKPLILLCYITFFIYYILQRFIPYVEHNFI